MIHFTMPKIPFPNKADWEYFLSYSAYEYLLSICESLQTRNRFFVDFRFQKLLYWLSKTKDTYCKTDNFLSKGKKIYRARIYYPKADQEERKNYNETERVSFRGYCKVGSFVPPSGIAVVEGRANPSYIRYLYAAEDITTAVAEVKPPLHSKVSVATIQVNSRIRLFNFSSLVAYCSSPSSPEEIWVTDLILAIMRTFNTPAEMQSYLLCQYISEFAKSIGYDGIVFRSSLLNKDYQNKVGINYTIFNYRKCEAIASEIYQVTKKTIDLQISQ